MSRAPSKGRPLVLPAPPEKYDPADQRELRRLVEEGSRHLPDWNAMLSVPGLVAALAALAGAADLVPYCTGPGAMDVTALTTFARSVLAATDAAAARTTLGAADAGLQFPHLFLLMGA